MSLFGPIIDKEAVEVAVRDHLVDWMPTYVAEMERQRGLNPGDLEAVREYVCTSDFKKWPEEALPTVAVICPGLDGEPSKDGSGDYTAPWQVGVAAIVAASDTALTRKAAGLYAAAIRGAILQHQSVSGLASGVDWVGERYDDIPEESGRTLASGQVIFRVWVPETIRANDGPVEPDVNPPTDWPTADTVDVQVQKEDI